MRWQELARNAGQQANGPLGPIGFRHTQNRQEPVCSHYFSPSASALAVALMIASDVIVALLVASMPATLLRSTIIFGVSVIDE